MNYIHTNRRMKNKKVLIAIIVAVLILIIIGVCVIVTNNKNTKEIEDWNISRDPDVVIQGSEENPIKLDGFEVTNIDIYNISSTSLKVKATIVNNSKETATGFFIEIGLFDDNGKQVTVIAENHQKEIKQGEKYVLESSVVGDKKISTIKSAKILSLEKETTKKIEDQLTEMIPDKNP